MSSRKTLQYNLEYAVMNGLNWMTFCVTFSFAGVFLLGRGYSSTELGLILAVGNLLALPLQALLADIADRARRVTLLGLISGMLLCLLAFATGSLLLPGRCLGLTVLSVLSLAGLQAMQPLVNSFSFYLSSWAGTPINFGVCRAVGSVSYAVVSLFAASAVERFGVRAVPGTAMVLFGVFLLVMAVFYFQRKKAAPTGTAATQTPVRGEGAGVLAFFRKYPRFALFLAGVALVFIGHSFINNFTLQVVENVGGDTVEMGRLTAAQAVLELPAMLGFSLLLKRFRCSTMMRLSLAAFTAKIALTYLAGSIPMLYAATLFQALAYGLFIPASVQYAQEVIGPEDAVKGQAFITSMLALGTVLSGVAGGRLTDLYGVSTALLAWTAATLIGSVLAVFGTQQTKKHPVS